MKKVAPLQPFLLFLILTFCAFSAGCAGPLQSVGFGQAAVLQSVAGTQNPLVAQYSVATDCPGQAMVEFGPDASYGRTTAWNPIPGGYVRTSILVAGMRASTTYHMRSQIQCASGATENSADVTFATGALPSLTLPALTVTRPNPSSSSPENPGIEMITVTEANYPAFFTDRDANPIWYYDVGQGNYPFTFKLLPNGHMILSITEPTDSLIREVDLAGNPIREMNIFTLQQKLQSAGYDFSPLGFHHDLLPLENGHLVVLVNCVKNFTNLPGYPGTTGVEGDALVDLDQNWNPVWAWNSFDYIGNGLDVNRHLNGLPDWTHSNALLYSPSDGNLLLSMRHQSWVLKINYSNGTGDGNIIWHLGYQGDFALTANGVPTDDPSVWFSFQHFPSLISQTGSETTLAVWDNGDNRVLDSNGDLCSYPGTPSPFPNCYSRATEFQIDEGAMVANLVWGDPQQYYGFWGGSINQLPNGNVEFDLNDPIIEPGPNVAAYVQEVTQNSNPQVIWQMDIAAPAVGYRAYRVPSLYNGVSWPY
jgi:arylsulfate sulfotransferase